MVGLLGLVPWGIRGYFVGPKFFLVAILWVQSFFLVGASWSKIFLVGSSLAQNLFSWELHGSNFFFVVANFAIQRFLNENDWQKTEINKHI